VDVAEVDGGNIQLNRTNGNDQDNEAIPH